MDVRKPHFQSVITIVEVVEVIQKESDDTACYFRTKPNIIKFSHRMAMVFVNR